LLIEFDNGVRLLADASGALELSITGGVSD
jgi:hypothetical protein